MKQTGLGDTIRFLPRQATNNVASNENLPMSRCTWLGTTPRTLPRQAGAAFVDSIHELDNIAEHSSFKRSISEELLKDFQSLNVNERVVRSVIKENITNS